jgi:hypothetical protein
MMAMRSGASLDVGEQPPIPGPAPLMPSRESFARTYYASTAVSSLLNQCLPLCFASQVANIDGGTCRERHLPLPRMVGVR